MGPSHDGGSGQGFAAQAHRRHPLEHILALFVTIAALTASFWAIAGFFLLRLFYCMLFCFYAGLFRGLHLRRGLGRYPRTCTDFAAILLLLFLLLPLLFFFLA